MEHAVASGLNRLLLFEFAPGARFLRPKGLADALAVAAAFAEGWASPGSASSVPAMKRAPYAPARLSTVKRPSRAWYAKPGQQCRRAATASSRNSAMIPLGRAVAHRDFRPTAAIHSPVPRDPRSAAHVTARWVSALALSLAGPTQVPEQPRGGPTAPSPLLRHAPGTWEAALRSGLRAWPRRKAWGNGARHVDSALVYCEMLDEATQFGTPLRAVFAAASPLRREGLAVSAAQHRPAEAMSGHDAACVMKALPATHARTVVELHRAQVLRGQTFTPQLYAELVARFGRQSRWEDAAALLRPLRCEPGMSAALAFVIAAGKRDAEVASAAATLRGATNRVTIATAAAVMARHGAWKPACSIAAPMPTSHRHVVAAVLQREGVSSELVSHLLNAESVRPSTSRQQRHKK